MHYSIAVVDTDREGCWVWHVNANYQSTAVTNRLTGAWNFQPGESDLLVEVTRSRLTVRTQRTRSSEWNDFITGDQELDVEILHSGLTARIEELQATFEAEQSSRSKSMKLAPPAWPMPPALDLGLSLIRLPEDMDQTMVRGRRCLALAHWLGSLFQAWEDVEEQRLARPLLRKIFGEDPQRMLPLIGGVA